MMPLSTSEWTDYYTEHVSVQMTNRLTANFMRSLHSIKILYSPLLGILHYIVHSTH